MLSEFVGRLVELGQKAKAVDVVTHPSLPDLVFMRHGDQLTTHQVPPPPRRPTLAGLTDLVAMLRDETIAPHPEVYVGPTLVVAFLDATDRDERAVLPLTESARFRVCQEIEKNPRPFAPRDLVRFLRQTLWGGASNQLIQALSRLDFTRTSTGKTDVKHGRETLGRSVEAIVQQADDVPEAFTAQVPIWTTPGCPWTRPVEFSIYLDVEKAAVELSVLSDSCTTARNGALGQLRDWLAEALGHVAVFMGAP